jgi:hypothetical protein
MEIAMNNIQIQSKALDLKTIEELMQLTVAVDSFETLAQKIVDKCADLLPAELCTLWRLIHEGGKDKLILGASKGFIREAGEIPTYILNWDAVEDHDIKGITPWIAIRKSHAVLIPMLPYRGIRHIKVHGIKFSGRATHPKNLNR